MSYSNGRLPSSSSTNQPQRGPPGVGFKLTVNGNYDLENKKLVNVEDPTNFKDAVNKEYGHTHYLKLNGTTHMTADLDLRGNKIINPSEINMNRKLITNMNTNEGDDLSAVNMITLKKSHPNAPAPTHEVIKDIDLKELFNVVNSKQQSFTHLTANYDNLVSYNDVNNIFLSRKETFPMETSLDMGNNTIYNIKNPTEIDQGTNKGYVDQLVNEKADKTEVSDVNQKVDDVTNYTNNQYRAIFNSFLKLSGGTMTGQIDMVGKKSQILQHQHPIPMQQQKKYLDDEVEKTKDGIIDSHSLKDEIRYLMEDVNESSSESNIEVDGIIDLEKSPHKHNKKAYDLKLKKTSGENYASRLGFNMYKLPEGEYTICVEFFPVKMVNVSVNAVSSSLNIGQQTTTLFTQEGYARSIIHMHKWQISPPEYLMLDLHCEGETPIGQAYLIIYGIKGKYSDVPKNVFDQPFVFESGKMVMETDLDLNGKKILNYPKSKAVIMGNYRKAIGDRKATFTINGETDYHVFGFSLTIKKITLHVTIRDGPIIPENTRISLNISGTSKSQRSSGLYLDNNAISYSFDFAVAADKEFNLSLGNRGGITHANATILETI